ncbi:MAG: T9SS type A sorting domain-containing protein [Flavobacteriales bacterium]|nr:T9SS type A sorting domain-containing protein [Flavobacteriales bacterium]
MKKMILVMLAAVIASTGISQNGWNFDGTSDLVQTTYAGVMGSNARTVEAWIYPIGGGEQIITSWGTESFNGGRFTFRVKEVGAIDVIRIEIKGGGIDGSIHVGDSAWHHVAVTYDPTAINKYKLYVDGVLDVENNISTPLNVGASIDMRLGRRIHTTFTGWFEGAMDEVRVWDIARSQSEIAATMNIEFCNVPGNLVAYYQGNEGIAAGTNTGIVTLPDASGNGYDGTLTSFALTGATSNWVTGVALASSYTVNQTLVECNGVSVNVGTNTYNTTGIYTDVLTSAFTGCDSTVITDLTILAPITGTQTLTVCDGNSVVVGTSTYNTTGIYTDVLTSSAGCDSTVITDLTMMLAVSSTQTLNECAGFSITVGTSNYNSTGIYTDVLTSAQGCDSTVTTDLTINSIDNTTATTGNTITANLTGASYVWLDCDNGNSAIAGETNQSYSPALNGNYAVIVDNGACSDTSACVLITSVGITEMNTVKFNLFPNPAINVLHVQVSDGLTGYKINVFNVFGQQVYATTVETSLTSVNISSLANGIYMVEITNEKSSLRNRFIKN